MSTNRRGPQPQKHHVKRDQEWPAPADLPEAGQAMWRAIVASLPDGQLHEGDRPLMRQYVQASLLADEAAEHLRTEGQMVAFGTKAAPQWRPSPWLKAFETHAKTCALLAAKLRLCVSSRVRAEAAGLRTTPAGGAPWQTDEGGLLARPVDPADRYFT